MPERHPRIPLRSPHEPCPGVGHRHQVRQVLVEVLPRPGVHPAVATLRELEAETPGSVDADLAARVCGHDQNLILRLIDWAGNQEEAWRKTREEALQAQDGDTAETAKEQADQAEHTASILRRALRVVVTNHPPTCPDGTPLGTSAYNAPGYL